MNGRGQKNKRVEVPLILLAAFFILVVLLIVFFIARTHPSIIETILLSTCALALAIVPCGIFYLLLLGKRSKWKNFFTYDFKSNVDRDISEISDDEIQRKLNLHMNYALQYEAKCAESRLQAFINSRYGGIPKAFRPFLVIRILQLALDDVENGALDELFLSTPKEYFDELVLELHCIDAEELAKMIQYFRVVYPESKEDVKAALLEKRDYLNQRIVQYIRSYVHHFE